MARTHLNTINRRQTSIVQVVNLCVSKLLFLRDPPCSTTCSQNLCPSSATEWSSLGEARHVDGSAPNVGEEKWDVEGRALAVCLDPTRCVVVVMMTWSKYE